MRDDVREKKRGIPSVGTPLYYRSVMACSVLRYATVYGCTQGVTPLGGVLADDGYFLVAQFYGLLAVIQLVRKGEILDVALHVHLVAEVVLDVGLYLVTRHVGQDNL